MKGSDWIKDDQGVDTMAQVSTEISMTVPELAAMLMARFDLPAESRLVSFKHFPDQKDGDRYVATFQGEER